MRMKGFVVWQPWASLIAFGAKPWEFRSRDYTARPRGLRVTPGERVAVIAGARAVRAAEVRDLLERLDDAAGTTGLSKHPARQLLLMWEDHASAFFGVAPSNPFPTRCVVCTAEIGKPVPTVEAMPGWRNFINDSDRIEHAAWAWPMLKVERVPNVPARGGQGFVWVDV